jgi:hypothetical protein
MTADLSVAEQAARLAGRAGEVALCLDFDGTLSPIVDDPQAARPLHGIVELLAPLADARIARRTGWGDRARLPLEHPYSFRLAKAVTRRWLAGLSLPENAEQYASS